MKITQIICAENIIRDAESNQITIYNFFDEISSATFPLIISKIAIYIFLHKEGDEKETSFKLDILNNEEAIYSDNYKINFSTKPRKRALIKFNGISIPKDGVLRIVLTKPESSGILKEIELLLTDTSNVQED